MALILPADVAGARGGEAMEPPFHMGGIVAMFAIGTILGWLAGLYLKDGLTNIIGHVVVGTIGSFGGGYLAFEFLPELGPARLMGGAIAGAILLLFVMRMRR